MASKKPVLANDFDCFVSGFLSETFAKGVLPDYGYQKNHLPKTTGRERHSQSILTLIDWEDSEDS
jgi:hypothetical protein